MCDDGECDGEGGAVSGDGGCRAGGEGVEYYDVGGWADGDAELGGEVRGEGVVGGFGEFFGVGVLNLGVSDELKCRPDGHGMEDSTRERIKEYIPFLFAKGNTLLGGEPLSVTAAGIEQKEKL